jgi:nucleoside-diphosphate-sugar epimerase
MGTVNVLEFCRQTGARLTFVSSYLYGEPDYLPIDENHPLKSYNPYSHTKLLAESACRFYADNYKIPITILRPFNAYGPGQPGQFLISEIIGKALNPAIPVIEVMDLRPKRDYVYIDDIVQALMLTMHAPVGIFNIGSGISISVEEIIKQTLKIAGIQKEYRAKGNFRPNEILDLYADIRKARAELGWQPVVSFEAGLENCVLSNHSKH